MVGQWFERNKSPIRAIMIRACIQTAWFRRADFILALARQG